MSIIAQQGELEAFSDQMLAKEAQAPSGRYPMFLVVSELERRKDLRQRFQAQSYKAGMPSVVEQRIQEMMGQGIPTADPIMQQPPQQMPPQMDQGIMGFAEGGMIGYANGGQVDPDPDPWWKRRKVVPYSPYADLGLPWTLGPKPPPFTAPLKREDLVREMAYRDLGRPTPQELATGTIPGRSPEPSFLTDPAFQSRLEPSPLLDEGIARMGEMVENYPTFDQERWDELTGAQKDAILALQRGESDIEKKLMEYMKSPDEIRQHKLALAASGLGALIGGSANLGAIPAGMAPLTREIMAEDERLGTRNQELELRSLEMKEAREAQNAQTRMAAAQLDAEAFMQGQNLSASLAAGRVDAQGALVNALTSRETSRTQKLQIIAGIESQLLDLEQQNLVTMDRVVPIMQAVSQAYNVLQSIAANDLEYQGSPEYRSEVQTYAGLLSSLINKTREMLRIARPDAGDVTQGAMTEEKARSLAKGPSSGRRPLPPPL